MASVRGQTVSGKTGTIHSSANVTGLPHALNRAARLVYALCLIGVSAGAEGFRNPPPSAFGLGRSGGRFAQVDDASAVWHNPANLVNLTNSEVEFTPSVVYMKVDYSPPAGSSTETTNPWKFLPNAFAVKTFSEGRYAVGLGLTVPYGLSVEWDESPSSPFHYVAPYYNELKTINANPTFAFRITDTLSFGTGLDVMWSQLEFRQYYPWASFPGSTGTEPEGNAVIQGDGIAVGGNVALTWDFLPRQRLAVTYRTRIDSEFTGTFNINNITPTASSLGVTPESPFSSKITFPSILGIGYGVELSDKVRIELSFERVEFSTFESLNLNLGNNALLLPSTTIPENWKDTFTAGIGGDWRISDNLVLRAGYQFYQSPVPDDTFSPSIPDANQHVFTIGAAYTKGHHTFEAAYGLDLYDQRDIATNPAYGGAYNGTYDITVYLFSFAYHYAF